MVTKRAIEKLGGIRQLVVRTYVVTYCDDTEFLIDESSVTVPGASLSVQAVAKATQDIEMLLWLAGCSED
jgi:hypothetical protein